MILVVGGTKGGGGKTTLATNLTVLRAKSSKVLFVDADEQCSGARWAAQRMENTDIRPLAPSWVTIHLSGKYINSELQKLKPDYDYIIIDTGGRDTTSQRSALCVADYFLIPYRPRTYDVWTIGEIKRLISEVLIINPNLKCRFVINQGDCKGKDNESTIEILKECKDASVLPVIIGNRKSFSNAASDGLGVVEYAPVDQKAIKEIEDLYGLIYE